MDNVGKISGNDLMLKRLGKTTQAARTGGPGGLVFNGRVRLEPPLLEDEALITTLPYPTPFQQAWRTTGASVVEADRSGATGAYMAPDCHGHDMEVWSQLREAMRS